MQINGDGFNRIKQSLIRRIPGRARRNHSCKAQRFHKIARTQTLNRIAREKIGIQRCALSLIESFQFGKGGIWKVLDWKR